MLSLLCCCCCVVALLLLLRCCCCVVAVVFVVVATAAVVVVVAAVVVTVAAAIAVVAAAPTSFHGLRCCIASTAAITAIQLISSSFRILLPRCSRPPGAGLRVLQRLWNEFGTIESVKPTFVHTQSTCGRSKFLKFRSKSNGLLIVNRLSTDFQLHEWRPTVDRLLIDCWPTVDRLPTDCRPTVDQLSIDCRPTDFDRLSTDRRPTGPINAHQMGQTFSFRYYYRKDI